MAGNSFRFGRGASGGTHAGEVVIAGRRLIAVDMSDADKAGACWIVSCHISPAPMSESLARTGGDGTSFRMPAEAETLVEERDRAQQSALVGSATLIAATFPS
jgi:hypothetical protein